MRRNARPTDLFAAIAVSVILSVPMAAGAAMAESVTTTTGSIAAVKGGSVTIASPILRREAATLGAIKPGTPLAVTAKKGAEGSLTAVSINIFSPQLWSRVRKGQWMMDTGNIMTNALVTQVVERVDGRTLYMKLAQGTGIISVPHSAEIHRLITVRLVDLKPGVKVTIRGIANSDGTIKASSITFDRQG